ncbi:MAG TPA: SIMPL domain-containing protein [Casimicrobiaceae bacterium]|nr:SIMPL domain-containing protein [Casimicrobiaceae bacterium]
MNPFGWRAIAPRASAIAVLVAIAAVQAPAMAQPVQSAAPPAVTVTGTATVTVANDQLQAWLRAEAENPNAAAAASQVNAAIARALADARAFPAVKAATIGYSTQQIVEKGKPTRWQVTQTLSLESSDFTAATTLITRLQDSDGLLLSGMSFSLADKTRRDAEDGVTRQAIRMWQSRADQAARALGFASWRVGHVSVQSGDGGRPRPLMRAQASTAGFAPVAVEAGTADVSVTVSGDAVLESPVPAPTR